ncbi:hypothetical protein PAHAL_8G060600 [Panicum hallii]|uniref:Uncharacterized protein n=1 Tax=Panicum hallii TaxID=206008 RepID=A0A2S3ID25_9POAL|nr:hypothetical protein PAHAL_8G060600 [Panicum hallii]
MATGKSNTTRILYLIAAVSMVVLVIMSSAFSVSCAEKDLWECHRLRFDCDEIKCATKCQVLYGGKSLYNKCGHYQVCCCRLRSNLTSLTPPTGPVATLTTSWRM